MQTNFLTETRSGVLFTLFVLGLVTTLVLLPSQFSSEAGATGGDGLFQRTVSHDPSLPDYDIRLQKSQDVIDFLVAARQAVNKDASAVAVTRDDFVQGESELRSRVPSLKIEYNLDIRIPEVIGSDVAMGRNFLTPPTRGSRVDTLRGFLEQNGSLVGMNESQIASLKTAADYTNPDGNLSFTHLEQQIGGIPVFRGEVKAGFTKNGEIVRVINNLAPGLEYDSLSSDFGDPLNAVKAAARHINNEAKGDVARNDKESTDLKVVFGSGDWATTAEKMYFPTEPGVARTAWRVLIWLPVNAYYVIVDAETGSLLWRKNLGSDQTQAATYNVYVNPNAMINVADNPFPLSPGPIALGGTQGPGISRTLVTRVGNEAPYTFNNNGWITDGGNETNGNALEAGLDRDATNGVDIANGRAVGAARVFDYPVNPLNPNTNTGDSPIPPGEITSGCTTIVQPHGFVDAQRAAITQLFYITNWFHDETYRLGFTEQARNFQQSNFSRGGVENDRVSGEAQDCSGTNNANFSTPADGGRGRMQMYIWTGPTPDLDGDFDAEVVIHEYTHGISNRLHGNASGLSTNMSGGMGEGWSDFYAHSALSEPTDPINGVYAMGGYDTYRAAGGGTFVDNYYYGIRRFPKAVMAFTGGPLNRPHNPLTFADADSTQFNIGDGAFSRGPFGSATVDQVHNLGEIWSSALWEVRAKFITRLGGAAGNRKALQLVTDGMKLAPIGPNFLQERDAIVAAAQASSAAPEAGADVADIWAGFAIRGMGFGASITASGSGANNTRVVEAFNLPNLVQAPALAVSDSPGDNDGFPEPGEPVLVNLPLTNNTGNTATGTTVQIVGGGSADYGTINNGQTVAQNVSYTVPLATPCGSAITLTVNVNSSLGATSFTRVIIIGIPQTTFTENFDTVTAPTFPAGWTAVPVSSGIPFVNSTLNPDTAPNSAYALNPATVGGGTDLTSPSIPITASAATMSFRNRYDTEPGWDGGALEISINGGAYQDVIAAGGRFIANGYNGVLGAGTNNPLANRSAWNGNSSGYLTSTVQLPAGAAGQNVQLKWRFGADDNTVGQGPNPGWYVDTVSVTGNYACSFTPVSIRSRADFDGDGRSDVSIFRPSEGNWYLNRSTAGFVAFAWGISSDTLVPGDYDNDNKTDTAVFRPVADGSQPDFYILNSNGFVASGVSWGVPGDIPVVADYDNDGRTDVAVYRPSNATWYAHRSSDAGVIVAQNGVPSGLDVPVAGNFGGSPAADFTVFRFSTGTYITHFSGGGGLTVAWGNQGDILVPADYTGDNVDDFATFRPNTGTWIIRNSATGSITNTAWGMNGDVPVPGDYDGDGSDDLAIFRNGTWWLRRSTAGVSVQNFGFGTDKPVESAYTASLP